jgi:ABC-type branched-subunit amino acid transport system substrate-binding protein
VLRSRVAALAVTAVATGVVAVSVAPAGTSSPAAKKCSFTLRIGDVLPFTGDLAAYGANLDRAVKIGVGLQNAALEKTGLSKRISVKLVGSEDGQTQASASVEAATKLVKSNHANVIIGEMASSATIPMARPERHQVAVREVDEPQDPVDDGHADRGDRDHRAGHESVREQLQEHG